jgi:hypothetical protein
MNDERIANNRASVHFDEKKILGWAKKHSDKLQWNGRQIRNAFQTAVALGEFKAKNSVQTADVSSSSIETPHAVMDISHFKTIAKASAQFNEYLRLVHGIEEDKVAVKDRWRADPESQLLPKAFEYSSDDISDSDSDKSSDDESGDDGKNSDTSSESGKRRKKKAKSKSKSKKEKEKEKSRAKKK